MTAQRAGYSKPTVERQFVRFSGKIRSAEDCKDLSSVYFGEARFRCTVWPAQSEERDSDRERERESVGVRERQQTS